MSFEEVEEQLTLPRYNSLQKHWTKWPPVSVIAAIYTGYKQGDKEVPATGPQELDAESAAALESVFGPIPRRKGNEDERATD